MKKCILIMLTLLLSSPILLAQGARVQSNDATAVAQPADRENMSAANLHLANHVPSYRASMVARTIRAVNYLKHKVTPINFHGTGLLPGAGGGADVYANHGAVKVAAEFRNLPPASGFGPEYLTYVLWAISPEGRPVNLGEVLPDRDGKAKIEVASDLRSFGMIVTAEPYFSVTRPSNVVVLENFVTPRTNGTPEGVEATYELFSGGYYTANINPRELTRLIRNSTDPIEIYEARNAIRIAKWSGAHEYATDTFRKAERDLRYAEGLLGDARHRNDLIVYARDAAQLAEGARLVTIRKVAAEENSRERRVATEAQASALRL